MKILVVDDEKGMRFLLEGFLRQCGYTEILSAPSAAKAYEKLSEISSTPEVDEVDLILMDVNMPGINGVDACRHIKTDLAHPDTQIIMVTGVDEAETLTAAFDAGAMDYIKKPIVKEDLKARVRSALAMKQAIDFQKNTIAELTEKRRNCRRRWKTSKSCEGCSPFAQHAKKYGMVTAPGTSWKRTYQPTRMPLLAMEFARSVSTRNSRKSIKRSRLGYPNSDDAGDISEE